MNNTKKKKEKYPPGTFVPYNHYFPESIEQETRKVVLAQDMFELPAGLYLLIESYCHDIKCDCRKVMINVIAQGDIPDFSNTIGFGWESAKFYSKWIGDEKAGSQMVGAYLEPGRVNSDRSQKYLDLVKNSLRDPYYVDLIKRHYQSFKNLLKAGKK